ncbi:MAG: hypothetical protein ACAI43_02945 [Phycisphaerae bacterium]|nr:hypothetical protein [Tepidisphaeraceae bacterium]
MSSDSSIFSTQSHGGAESSALGGLWSIYYRRGYEDGYRQVARDLLGALVTISEEFIKARGAAAKSDESRRLVYAFEHHLEQQIEQIAGQAGFVEGGLGI